MAALIAKLFEMLMKAIVIAIQVLAIVFLGLLVAVVFIIPWLIRIGGLLVFAYGLYEITLAVNAVYAAFTDTVPLVALYVFVAIVQLSIFFLLSALDLRLVWGATYFSGASMLWLAKRGIVQVLANWQHAGLFFRALPPLLFIALVATETLKAARKREGYPTAQYSGILSGAIRNGLDRIESIALPVANAESNEATNNEKESQEGGDAA